MKPELSVDFPVQVWDAAWAITSRHLPLDRGRDRIAVSPEAARFLPSVFLMASEIDFALHGVEMRLVRR